MDADIERPYILAIESSCDDTGAAIIRGNELLSHLVSNQIIHKNYGGVVPELASRQHESHIVPVVHAALEQANVKMSQLGAIAFTQGPGLLGSLLVGCSFAKTMAWSLDIPLIAVNHMEAHIMAHFIDDPKPTFPFLCLTVSGGHTELIIVHSPYDMTPIGRTRDDAAGEAFDKIGKYLGLDYPAGPIIDRLAKKGTPKFSFPKSKLGGYEFSFSGLKTAVLYFLRDEVKKNPDFIAQNLADICCSIQTVIVDVLTKKVLAAAKEYDIKEIAIAGGVSANSGLRNKLEQLANLHEWNIHIPPLAYCTDNAAMIAIAGYYKYLKGDYASLDITPDPRMKIA